MNQRRDTGPDLGAESAVSLATNVCLVDRIRAYDYHAVAYAVSGPRRRVAWFIHAHPRDRADSAVAAEISEFAGAQLLMHVVRNYLPRSGPTEAPVAPGATGAPIGPVIESFPIDPYDVRDQVDFTWVDSLLFVSAREPNSFRRCWHHQG